MKNNKLVIPFESISLDDVALVGGKNASLGEMVSQLSSKGVRVPTGFAVTAQAYRHYVNYNNLSDRMDRIMQQLDGGNAEKLRTVGLSAEVLKKAGHEMRELLLSGSVPDDLHAAIADAYRALSYTYNQENCDVAVRSSATAEDLPHASFAGQQETFLHINGIDQLIEAYKKCVASLYTDRAIAYRIEQGFAHTAVALSVGVQKMVRSDLAVSGVAFSLDTETGFTDVIMIESSYGLGETIVQGMVTPDEFLVYKPSLSTTFDPIIKKRLGDKTRKLVYASGDRATALQPVEQADRQKFSLSEEEIIIVARAVLAVEQYYGARAGRPFPVDIEWAKDGVDGLLYIVQTRAETVHSIKKEIPQVSLYQLDADDKKLLVLATGKSVGQRIVSGVARVIQSAHEIASVRDGDIIVTDMTDPDWVPAMRRAGGIITNRGGRTCHAAIVSRELGIPAVVGTSTGTAEIKDGQPITLDCSHGGTGYVYEGVVPFTVRTLTLDAVPHLPVEVQINMTDPESAFANSFLPTDGVGLLRLEFLIAQVIKIHPLALLEPEKIESKEIMAQINECTAAYPSKKDFFIDILARGIAQIAAAFNPRPITVRFSDFKTNEYRNLIGGIYFEPHEENPMIGFRGASRYCSDMYRAAFALECAAIKKVRDDMGFTNVKVMVPFVRTLAEAACVLGAMQHGGIERGKNGLQVYMMCEIPSNALLMDDFSILFDGISIGSNDLTQLVLGIERDTQLLANLFDERDPAVKKMITMAVEGAKRHNVPVSVCGQGPSDFPEFAQFLIDAGVNVLSLNADVVVPFLMRYAKK